MAQTLVLDPDRFFPHDRAVRSVARTLFEQVEQLPIVSPHGHVDPAWFAHDAPFEDAVSVFLWPDHYVLRMLYSQGVGLGELGIAGGDSPVERDRRAIWRLFAANYRLFRGTPSRLWLDHAFATVFGLDRRVDAGTADHYFDVINEALATAPFRPRALFQQFGIEVIATTEGALDSLEHHRAIKASGWDGRVITTFRPDDVVDPSREDFVANLAEPSLPIRDYWAKTARRFANPMVDHRLAQIAQDGGLKLAERVYPVMIANACDGLPIARLGAIVQAWLGHMGAGSSGLDLLPQEIQRDPILRAAILGAAQ